MNRITFGLYSLIELRNLVVHLWYALAVERFMNSIIVSLLNTLPLLFVRVNGSLRYEELLGNRAMVISNGLKPYYYAHSESVVM